MTIWPYSDEIVAVFKNVLKVAKVKPYKNMFAQQRKCPLLGQQRRKHASIGIMLLFTQYRNTWLRSISSHCLRLAALPANWVFLFAKAFRSFVRNSLKETVIFSSSDIFYGCKTHYERINLNFIDHFKRNSDQWPNKQPATDFCSLRSTATSGKTPTTVTWSDPQKICCRLIVMQ